MKRQRPATPPRAGLCAEIPCALCGRADVEPVSTRDRRGKPLRTVMCDHCGLVWTSPRPSDEEVDRYYARDYREDYAGTRVPTARVILRGLLGADERRRALGPLLSPGCRVLDVGCGAGEFVYLLRQHGIEASGVEPGEAYADFSRQVLDIPVLTGTVQKATVAPGSQDVITLFHMLEHVADPLGTLAAIAVWLSPQGGTLVVEVPNVESTVQAPNHRFHFAHLYSFNACTLRALGEAAGLRPVRTYLSWDGGNVTCLFERGLEGPQAIPAMPDNVRRLREMLRSHTSIRHYTTPVPYRRAIARLRRRWQEDRLLRQYRTVSDVLSHLAGSAESRLD